MIFFHNRLKSIVEKYRRTSKGTVDFLNQSKIEKVAFSEVI